MKALELVLYGVALTMVGIVVVPVAAAFFIIRFGVVEAIAWLTVGWHK